MKCKHCNKPLEYAGTGRPRKYCAREECQRVRKAAVMRDLYWRNKKWTYKVCPECEVEFLCSRSDQRFCCVQHQKIYNSRRRWYDYDESMSEYVRKKKVLEIYQVEQMRERMQGWRVAA